MDAPQQQPADAGHSGEGVQPRAGEGEGEPRQLLRGHHAAAGHGQGEEKEGEQAEEGGFLDYYDVHGFHFRKTLFELLLWSRRRRMKTEGCEESQWSAAGSAAQLLRSFANIHLLPPTSYS